VDVLEEWEKMPKLLHLMDEVFKSDAGRRMIIFAGTKRKVDNVTKTLRENGYDT